LSLTICVAGAILVGAVAAATVVGITPYPEHRTTRFLQSVADDNAMAYDDANGQLLLVAIFGQGRTAHFVNALWTGTTWVKVA